MIICYGGEEVCSSINGFVVCLISFVWFFCVKVMGYLVFINNNINF